MFVLIIIIKLTNITRREIMSFERIIFTLVIAILIFIIYMAVRKIKWQDKYVKNVLEEKSKMSDKLRLKGIVVDRLAERIKKAEKKFNIRIVG